MKECKYAKKYKGIKPPKCNNGDPCDACKAIWEKAQALKEAEELTIYEARGAFGSL